MFDEIIRDVQNITEGENCFYNKLVYTVSDTLNIVERRLVSVSHSNSGKTIFCRLIDASSKLPVEIARVVPQGQSRDVIFIGIQDLFLEYFETKEQAKVCLKNRLLRKAKNIEEKRVTLRDEIKQLDINIKELKTKANKITRQ